MDRTPEAPDALRASPWRSRGRVIARLLTVGISVSLLYLLYRAINFREVGEVLRHANVMWLVISVGLIAPITVLRAARFMWLLPIGALSGLGEATRITLVASVFNMFLPVKSGDFVKSLIVARRRGASAGLAASVVVYERLSDMAGMVIWGIAGTLVIPQSRSLLPPEIWVVLGVVGAVCIGLLFSERAASYLARVANKLFSAGRLRRLRDLVEGWPMLLGNLRRRRVWLAMFSLGLWFVQLAQIWMFTLALSAEIPLATCASLSAIALIVAQLPITFAGIGTRDVALVLLLSEYMSPEKAAAVGILTASRGLLPPLAALPVLRKYLGQAVQHRALDEASTGALTRRATGDSGADTM